MGAQPLPGIEVVVPSDEETLLAGRYRLDRLIGCGGMADVHRAWDLELGRAVAVKVFRPGDDLTAGRRFDNEARVLAGLSHPGLVPVHDAGRDQGLAFVVLALVEGGTLRDRLAAGPLVPDEVRALGVRLAEALEHVHSCGVVHRDVKPSNVLVDTAGTAYLADFGLARLVDATRLTRADQIVGTAAYLAPEQVRGGPTGPAADVYALGLVLLECLTGRREYDGGEIEAAVARLHRAPHVPADLPPDLAELLRRMTATDARDRPTAAECARALIAGATFPGAAFAGSGLRAAGLGALGFDQDGAPHEEAVRTGRSWNVVFAAAALLGVVGAVGFAWSSTGEVSDPPPRVAPSGTQRPVQPAVETVTVTVPVPTEAQPVQVPATGTEPVGGTQPVGGAAPEVGVGAAPAPGVGQPKSPKSQKDKPKQAEKQKSKP
ncbi:protein kinase [Saccharothrix sp. BKS2]|uniref:serine/threonine-protein kinase n=1 Tax=Saccharothrix sp. BKS2 TaxID=3064400 RepID=UPI0039E900F2